MTTWIRCHVSKPILSAGTLLLLAVACVTAGAGDLGDVKARGVLHHLGIPYANFVTGSGDGLDVEVIQRFAAYLGVKYEYVETSWQQVIGDLTGKVVKPHGESVEVLDQVPIRGDLIANGFTMLPWRRQVVDFSVPTFPSGVWLIARADAEMSPVEGTGDAASDVVAVKSLLRGHQVLAMKNTCLDPGLYALDKTGVRVALYTRSTNLNEMVPAILQGSAEATLLDVPDALIALDKWPGRIKVIGPVSSPQLMGVGFPKSSPELRKAFDEFFERIWRDGTYRNLVKKYYPTVLLYFGDFFAAPVPKMAASK
ncbi:MAG: transporter substrate-binding domain-containing protein [Chromatiaceae bacterium]